MSVGEITTLYRDKELIIRPSFQRFFRWSALQKSRLIESLLLGIPLPSIFVSQTTGGTWELVDGLQRISTILELQGELLDENGNKLPPLQLRGTKYLPALEGCLWDSVQGTHASLSDAQRLDIKRAKLDIKIIKRESSASTKFDLFQRLNSFGSPLNDQEMRSALLVAVSPEFFAWIESLVKFEGFVNAIQLSERLAEERYDLELALRFLVLHNRAATALTQSALRDFPQVLDDASIRLAESFPGNQIELETTFRKTFGFIAGSFGENTFRKWDVNRKQFRGSFLNTSFEVFALGIGFHVANNNPYRTDLEFVVKEFWAREGMQSGYATGRSTEARLSDFVPLGRQILGLSARSGRAGG